MLHILKLKQHVKIWTPVLILFLILPLTLKTILKKDRYLCRLSGVFFVVGLFHRSDPAKIVAGVVQIRDKVDKAINLDTG